MKQFVLCADDYAQNAAVSQGILELIEKKRISATSCLTNSPHWPTHASWLKPYQNSIDAGLHFNLTEGKPLSDLTSLTKNGYLPSIKKLLIYSHLGLLEQQEIVTELEQQLYCFTRHFDQLPDFIDGHLHVHHLPIVREALLAFYQRYFPNKTCYIRIASNGWRAFFSFNEKIKSFIITASGALTLKQRLQQLNIPHNNTFSGIYNFANAMHYSHYFKKFLTKIADNGLIMCHPGLVDDAATDPLYRSRHHE